MKLMSDLDTAWAAWLISDNYRNHPFTHFEVGFKCGENHQQARIDELEADLKVVVESLANVNEALSLVTKLKTNNPDA